MDEAYNYPSGQISIPAFVNEEGVFEVVLTDKMWGYKTNLICVFKTDFGETFSTTAWRRESKIDSGTEIYSPKKTEIDFKYISRGTKWKCLFELAKNKKYYNWIEAVQILN